MGLRSCEPGLTPPGTEHRYTAAFCKVNGHKPGWSWYTNGQCSSTPAYVGRSVNPPPSWNHAAHQCTANPCGTQERWTRRATDQSICGAGYETYKKCVPARHRNGVISCGDTGRRIFDRLGNHGLGPGLEPPSDGRTTVTDADNPAITCCRPIPGYVPPASASCGQAETFEATLASRGQYACSYTRTELRTTNCATDYYAYSGLRCEAQTSASGSHVDFDDKLTVAKGGIAGQHFWSDSGGRLTDITQCTSTGASFSCSSVPNGDVHGNGTGTGNQRCVGFSYNSGSDSVGDHFYHTIPTCSCDSSYTWYMNCGGRLPAALLEEGALATPTPPPTPHLPLTASGRWHEFNDVCRRNGGHQWHADGERRAACSTLKEACESDPACTAVQYNGCDGINCGSRNYCAYFIGSIPPNNDEGRRRSHNRCFIKGRQR